MTTLLKLNKILKTPDPLRSPQLHTVAKTLPNPL